MRNLTNIIDVFDVNSRCAVVRIHKDNFVNSEVFVEHVAEDIGICGKVVDYTISPNNTYVDIYFYHEP